ncbi:hypothetical protein GCM10011380_04320 [Sphingomonas metalli]|uniref:Lipoprotein n=1 Tax=Sphingomonas metalli TaxID=1779358 RepID=A0A916SU02_9SPHN|nr:hypothetical protein [Sphingomonas metalli]GGB17912.1 hypothetical protein GCM10011380_04320 [Sphingomonas metalli]
MRSPLRPALVLVALLAAGCVPQVAPPPVATPGPTPTPAAPPPPRPLAQDWRDWPRTPGDWRYDAATVVARYDAPDGRPLLTLACDRAARRITVTRPSVAAAAALTVRTTSTVRALAVQARAPADATSPIMLDATLAAGDRLLDAMAFSRGTFTVEQAGQSPLVLPAWAEVGRVVQDCR